jgi:hypothetical protein
VAVIAVETGIAPSVLWMETPEDLATLVSVLEARAKRTR